jgi:hypothetical protein
MLLEAMQNSMPIVNLIGLVYNMVASLFGPTKEDTIGKQ